MSKIRATYRSALRGVFAAATMSVIGCSPQQKESAAEQSIFLKCQGLVAGQTVLPGILQTNRPEPHQFSFRIRPKDKEIDVWREGKFDRLCHANGCLKTEGERYSFSTEREGEKGENIKKEVAWMFLDRSTGAIKFHYLYNYGDSLMDREFNGTCEKATLKEISSPKF